MERIENLWFKDMKEEKERERENYNENYCTFQGKSPGRTNKLLLLITNTFDSFKASLSSENNMEQGLQ